MERAATQVLRLQFLDEFIGSVGGNPDIAHGLEHVGCVPGKSGYAPRAVFDRDLGPHRADRKTDLGCDALKHHGDVRGEGRHQKPARCRTGVGSTRTTSKAGRLVRYESVPALDDDGTSCPTFEGCLGPVFTYFRIVFDFELTRHAQMFLFEDRN